MNKLKQARIFAKKAYKGFYKPGGRTLFSHTENIVKELKKYKVSEETLIAAYLHDVVEDTNIKLEIIKKKFGNKVAFMVEILTKRTKTKKYMTKVIKGTSKHNEIIMIKIADLKDNLKNVKYFSKEKHKKVKKWFNYWYKELYPISKSKEAKLLLKEYKKEAIKTFNKLK